METLEHLIQLIRRDADTAIADRGDDLIAIVFDADENLASLRRVFHRVLQKISEDLLEPIAIAGDDLRVVGNVDMEAALADRRVMAVDDLLNERRPVDRLTADLETSGLDT